MLSAEFLQVWRQWLRKPAPTTNFKNGHAAAPTYQLEHDIDHSVTYIQGLVRSFIAGVQLDYRNLASKELIEVEQWLTELNCRASNETEKQKFLDYVSDMKLILQQLAVSPISLSV